MKANRFSIACSIGVLAVCCLCVLTWAVLWRPLGVLRIERWWYVTPTMALGMGLAAVAVMGWAQGGSARRQRVFGGVLMGLGALLLLENILMPPWGIESLLFADAATALLGSARPSPLSSMFLIFAGAGLQAATRPVARRFNVTDVFAAAILFPSFVLILGYLYQAPILTDGDMPVTSLPGAVLWACLALAMLAMNPLGVLGGERDRGVGTDARRRLMPAAVLVPALLGMAEAMALRAELLDPVLAVALTCVAGIVVSVVLLEWVAGLLAEREAEKEGELLQRETRAREEGMTDSLTGLLNRRGWDTRLKAVEDLYQREGGNACVIVIDLDGLKVINDTQGHGAGDALIRRAGRALEAAGRREDFVARIGGDEFVYLAVDCQPQHAEIVMERLAGALQRASVHASLGYAMRDLAGTLQDAFKEADQAMYADKRARKAARKTG